MTIPVFFDKLERFQGKPVQQCNPTAVEVPGSRLPWGALSEKSGKVGIDAVCFKLKLQMDVPIIQASDVHTVMFISKCI